MARIDLDQSTRAPGESRSRYVRIAEELRARIAAGEFGSGGRLPTTRGLARRLGVHRNTVVAAYAKLEEWGLARGHVGRGTFASPLADRAPSDVSAPPPRQARPLARHLRRAPASFSRKGAPWSGVFSRSLDGRAVETLSAVYSVGSAPGTLSFAGSFPAADLLPVRAFGRALSRALASKADRALTYGPSQGYLPLRRWVAQSMTGRGMPTSAEEVLITNGSQQAIDLIARALTEPGDGVILENPTYTGAIASFQSYGARLLGADMDERGVLSASLSSLAARGSAKLAYLTPSFQNPTAAVLSSERREEILQAAADANLLLVEDDWAGALRFEGKDPPTLRALDRDGRVIYVSTFAKMLIPGLRVGWIAAAKPIIERLTALKQITDCCTSPLIQSALDLFCREGSLERHLARVRPAYRTRRDRMMSALEAGLPFPHAVAPPPGGLFLWLRLPEKLDAGPIAAECAARGLLVGRGDAFFLDGSGPPALRLTFASSRPAQIERGVGILTSVIKRQLSSAGRRRARPAMETVPLV